MRLEIKNVKENPAVIMRRAGYIYQRNEGDEMSFVRPFSSSGYPRFHIYVEMKGSDMFISIHLDVKKETYGKGTRHHGEYKENGTLEEEARRLKSLLEK